LSTARVAASRKIATKPIFLIFGEYQW